MVENGQSDRLRPEPVGSGFRYLAWGTCFLHASDDRSYHAGAPPRFPSDWPMLHSTSSPYATCLSLPRPRDSIPRYSLPRCGTTRRPTGDWPPVSLPCPCCEGKSSDKMWMPSMSSQPPKTSWHRVAGWGQRYRGSPGRGRRPLGMSAVGSPPPPDSQPNERMLPEDLSRANWSGRCARTCR